MISNNIIICTKEELEGMCRLAYCDAQEGFEFKLTDYMELIKNES